MARSWLTRDRVALAAGLGVPFVVCAVLSLFRDSFANTDAALVLVLAIVAVAANGFRLAGILAALSAALWFDFFLTEPYGGFTIGGREDVETTVLLLAVGLAVTEVAVWGRRKAAQASAADGYLAGIRAATEGASTGTPGSVVADVSRQLVDVLGLTTCRFERGVAGLGQPARLRHDGEIERDRQVWDVEHRGLPVDVDIELLVETHGRLKGRYLMHAAAGSTPSQTQRLVAVTLAGQVAQSVD